MPVTPPKLKLNKNPITKNIGVIHTKLDEYMVLNQLNNFMPVGMAMIAVAVEK